MRVLVIPDLHGKDIWKELVGTPYDLCVFLGDYCDSYDHSNEQIINNLLDIIQYKIDNMDKVILLLGNHELPYIYLDNSRFKCSGHRPEIDFTLNDIFYQNKNLFINAFQVGKYIFTHAGIQNHWFNNVFKGDPTYNDTDSIAHQLNNPKDRDQLNALYHVGRRRGGYYDVGGIFWCDKSELLKSLKGYFQIVGHTAIKKVIVQVGKDSTVFFCDCLDNVEEPIIFIIDNDKNSILLRNVEYSM